MKVCTRLDKIKNGIYMEEISFILMEIEMYQITSWEMYTHCNNCDILIVLLPLDSQFVEDNYWYCLINSLKQAGLLNKNLQYKMLSEAVQRFLSYEMRKHKHFFHLKNHKTCWEIVLNIKCEFHFSLQLLLEIFFALINI